MFNGYNLGKWVEVQRRKYGKDELDPQRADRLVRLPNWTWKPHDANWEKGMALLLDYVKETGHARVPTSYTVDGSRLGIWVNVQRGKYAKGKLDSARQEQLAILPGWVWDAREANWEDAFEHLLKYVHLHGNARVPYGHVLDGFRLGQWVGRQRNLYAKEKLVQERKERLEKVHSSWTWNASKQ